MGTKKLDSGYITHVENQENWDKLLKFQGLFVADLYQEWNGPCRSIVSLFNKLAAEINSDKIIFAQVKVDSIRSLYMYKGKCEPTFLIMGGGQLVGVIRGSNAPIIRQTCLDKFGEELKVMQGEMERIVIRDSGIIRAEDVEDVLAETVYEFTERELTFTIIKPDVIVNNKINEMIDMIKEENFFIVKKEIRKLSKEEVMSLYSKSLSDDIIDEYTTFMTSSKCCIMALGSETENCVAKLREITGPKDVENAKASSPNSLRAIYGLAGFKNAIHSAETREEAIKSISIMFPDLVYKKQDQTLEDSERVVILLPERIYIEEKNSIIKQLMEVDLKIVKQTETTLSKNAMTFIYKDIINKRELFDERVEEMNGSVFYVICFECKNCINIVNYMLGLYISEEDMDYRKLSVKDMDVPDLVYASSDKENAKRDENYFFPIELTFAIIKPDAYEQRDEIIKLIKAGGFGMPLVDDIVLSTAEAEEIYKNIKESPFFDRVVENLTSDFSCVMVLSKFDAVRDWRDFVGSPNPEEAAEESPDKLRGIFGSTIIQNAIHGSATKEDVYRSINLIFGNSQFDERGNLSIQKPLISENMYSFPITIYRPESIDETKIQDVLKKIQFDKGMTSKQFAKEFTLKELAKFYSTIKNPELLPNLKCFIEIASNIIPVFMHEENSSFQKLDIINTSTRIQKNNQVQLEIWIAKFSEENLLPDLNYVIYKFVALE